MSGIEVNKGRDRFPSAVLIDRVGIMGGIQKELFNAEFRKVCFHGEKGMEKRKHVMPGSPFQKREYREIAVGIGGHIHVEMVTEEMAFPVRVPSPIAVRLRITALAAAGRAAVIPAAADPGVPLLCGSPDRSAVTGKSQMAWVDQSFPDRTIEELLPVETENQIKRILRFEVPAFQQGKKSGSQAGRIAGSFLAFLFSLWRFPFRETDFRGKVIGVILPDTGKEIIKRPDTGSIPERESTEDGIKRSFPEHAAPNRDGRYLQLQSKQIGAQHTGREPGYRAKYRVTVLQNGIGLGKIEIPELHDIIPSAFRKHERIRIKCKEIGYERILIGGMAARISR